MPVATFETLTSLRSEPQKRDDPVIAEINILRMEFKRDMRHLKCMFVVGIAIELVVLIGLIHSPI